MSQNKFAGMWDLIPELCLYQQGEIPVSGDYRINCEGDNVVITVQWEDSQGKPQSASYGGPLDGSKQVVQVAGFTHINFIRIDANTLDSGAFNDEQEVMYARRVVSKAGDLMSTVQTTRTDKGSFTNFQVYRRRNP